MSDQITTAQAIGICSTLAATLGGCVFGQIISQRMLLRYQDAEQKKILAEFAKGRERMLAELKARRTGETPLLEPTEASVDHVAELGEKSRPFFVNFFAEQGLFFREFLFELKLMVQELLLISKLLVQKLLLKGVVNNDAEKGAGEKADNADVGTREKGLNAHGGNGSVLASEKQALEGGK